MIRGVVFDMDGLMFDTENLAAAGWEHAGKQLGLNITRDFVIDTLGLDPVATQRTFQSRLGDRFDFQAAGESKTLNGKAAYADPR